MRTIIFWSVLGLIGLLIILYVSKKERAVFEGEKFKKLEAEFQAETEKIIIEELKKDGVVIDDEKVKEVKEIARRFVHDYLRAQFRHLELNPNDLKHLVTLMLETEKEAEGKNK